MTEEQKNKSSKVPSCCRTIFSRLVRFVKATHRGIARTGMWLAVVILALGVGTILYQWARTSITAEVYRERLTETKNAYRKLHNKYNELVKKSAVTELIVEEGNLKVRVRSPEGVLRTVDTHFDPDNEIYVDFVIANGRIWIRRIFDNSTSPDNAVVINPTWENPDWQSDSVRYGKAVYRSLEEGRWVVTVSGDGSLGLVRKNKIPDSKLHPPPNVQYYKQEEEKLNSSSHIGFKEILKHFFGKKNG